MKITIEPMLYTDMQARRPTGLCPLCGGERYAPTLICGRCERAGL